MGANKKKAYASGEAANYVTRKQAMKKLQLNLKDFRRLCILKGIHPREPRNRKRAQKGDMTKIQTLFHEKDIRFLLHEPIVWKFRDFKVFLRKLKKATDKGNYEAADRIKGNRPKYTLDHIVKERYPTFVDAIRDLEDCLCLCSLYATFPKNAKTPSDMIHLCKRLMVEFMHYVIEAKALKKVFVSIKGYYYQAEIMGQMVTWVVPHTFSYEPPENVDLKLMSIFVEFYTTMLGFVNFRLYHNLNIKYPPTLPGFEPSVINEESSEKVAALNQSLVRTVTTLEEEEVEIDNIPTGEDSEERMAEMKRVAEEMKVLSTLFKGSRFYLSREIPREALVFMIRAFGGEVSWDKNAAPGATFDQDDSSITHEVTDRPKESIQMKHVSRVYVQPQWVFDSINQRKLLPVKKYFVGEVLPPHLSPFVSERRIGDYVPPEEKKLLEGGAEEEKEGEEEKEEGDDEEVEEEEEEEEEESDEEGEDDEEEEDEEEEELSPEDKMKVTVGKPEKIDKEQDKKIMEEEEFRLRKMMIKRKHKGLYRSMMKSRKKRVFESKQLERKRKAHDEALAESKKTKKVK